MTVTYGGSITLGQAIPLAQVAQVTIASLVNASLPDVQARITGLLALQASPPPSLLALIAGVQATLAALQQMLAVPVPDVTATAAALAELQASLGSLSAGLAFANNMGSLLGSAGVAYFVAAGRAGDIGAELGSHLSAGLPGSGAGPDQQIAGAMLLASDGATIAALQQVLRS